MGGGKPRPTGCAIMTVTRAGVNPAPTARPLGAGNALPSLLDKTLMTLFRILFPCIASCALLLMNAPVALAQETREAEAYYTMVLSRTATMEQTEALCTEQARLRAIGEAFGYVVSETTVGNVSDENGRVTDAFSVLTRTSVRGEWLRDKEAPRIEWTWDGRELSVQVVVKGIIRSNSREGRTEVVFYPCTAGEPTAEQINFRHGQSLLARFRAAGDGYLSVFYVDVAKGEAYRVFPAPAYASLDHLEVKAQQEYLLFSRSHSKQFEGYPATLDLVLEVPEGKQQGMDELVAVYAPHPYKKPMLTGQHTAGALPSLRAADLEHWITELRTSSGEIVVKRTTLTIVK